MVVVFLVEAGMDMREHPPGVIAHNCHDKDAVNTKNIIQVDT